MPAPPWRMADETRGFSALIAAAHCWPEDLAGRSWPEVCELYEVEPEYRAALETIGEREGCTPLEALALVLGSVQTRVDAALTAIEVEE